MSSQVWVGAVATVVGVAIGGGISYLSNRQQMREARTQRLEEARREQYRRSVDRRFQAYSDFLTRVRSCRNVVRDYLLLSDHRPNVGDIDALVRTCDRGFISFCVAKIELFKKKAAMQEFPKGEEVEDFDQREKLLGFSRGLLLMYAIEFLLGCKGQQNLDEYIRKARIPSAKKYVKDILDLIKLST